MVKKEKLVSAITLVLSILIVVFCAIGDRDETYNTLISIFVTRTLSFYQLSDMTTFTFMNTLLTGIAALILIPVSIYTLISKNDTLPWIGLLKTATANVNIFVITGTFLGFVVMSIYRKDPMAALDWTLGGGGIFTHLITPLLVIAIFVISRDQINISHKSFLFCLLPSVIYFAVYTILVFGIGIWNDIYGLKDVIVTIGNICGSEFFGYFALILTYFSINFYIVLLYQIMLYCKRHRTYVNGVLLNETIEKNRIAKAQK